MKEQKGGLFCYTTSISPEKSISEIEKELTKVGANRIMKEYGEGGRPTALCFSVLTEKNGIEIPFRLPMEIEPVLQILKNQSKERRIAKKYADEEQAIRVGWRILLYWVKAQVAIIETRMVEVEQVFLPYIMVGNLKGKTLYDKYKMERKKFLELPEIVEEAH